MSNNELFAKVKGLQLPIGEYALFGSAPMGIRGLRECNDIDIIVTEELWNEYKSKSGWIVIHSYGLRKDDIELWKVWYPRLDIKRLIQEAEIIDGLPFVAMEEVLKWKRCRGREKDLKDIRVIESFLDMSK